MKVSIGPLRRIAPLTLIAVTASILLTTPAVASTVESGTKSLHLRKGLTLTIPKSWKVYRLEYDQVRVVTGSCANPRKEGFVCDGFWVYGPKTIEIGNEFFNPYTPGSPFYTSTGVVHCPVKKNASLVGGFKLVGKGLRQIGPGHKADYHNWRTQCYNGKIKRFNQREWYLPISKILIVDQWNTPGLPGILRNATWN
ncbi:hypothetical protein [Rhizohabitans arisaemae]|uniref:hypothetical protein n=1 Tax=Rhizohabitans arisaemae TaxID=2720610 RepID=UPI0024B11F8C|nr:hypothetical protein [Rhizohabitans arisaemae]